MLGVMYNSDVTHIAALTCALIVTVFIAIGLLFLIFYFAGTWKFYEKLGMPGWYCFIPFYRKWVLFEKLGLEWYWFLIYHAPLFLFFMGETLQSILTIGSIIGTVVYIYNVSKKFNKSKGWLVVAILFTEIAIPLLGFAENDKADDSVELTANGLFDDNKKKNISSKVKKVSKKIEKVIEEKAPKKENK